MFITYLIAQAATTPQVKLPDGSTFFKHPEVCVIEHARSSQGAYVHLRRYVGDENYMIFLSNESWKSLSSDKVQISIRFVNLPRVVQGEILKSSRKAPDPILAEAIVAQSSIDGVPSNVIFTKIGKESFDRLVYLGELNTRFAVYYKDNILTDYIRLDKGVKSLLDQCGDPFQN